MPDLILRQAALAHGELALAAEHVFSLRVDFSVERSIVFELDISLDIQRADDGSQVFHRQLRQDSAEVLWLPRGDYRCDVLAAQLDLPAGEYLVQLALWHASGGESVKSDAAALRLSVASGAGNGPQLAWQLKSSKATPALDTLSWRRGSADWFFKHFDHAARTVIHYFLDDSPLLGGRVLDVGCGDGITDLGIALRRPCVEFVGVDPFRGFERLPEILAAAQIPSDAVPPYLRFEAADANALPFADNHFDVVLSWGSLEHIVGGYAKALAEIRRVLKPGGLFFVHPGLFYSDVGNHLGEFAFARAEPYVHLKYPREALREMVLGAKPDYIDRCGEFSSSAQYWQWHTELNPIRVADFEHELRALDFEPWRVALRTQERVDYTPQLQAYSFVDLAVAELYVSCWNRKSETPQRSP